ncbi:MAG TPA: hypothetical protein VGR06_16470 [Actinophytocola sp.]|jgi:hypothetical protein|nr:hypothetical protein [Actinophytocola sp.]
MKFHRRLLIAALTVLLATAVEYGLIAANTSTSDSVATDGTIIVQN